jgi:hypothetical protein
VLLAVIGSSYPSTVDRYLFVNGAVRCNLVRIGDSCLAMDFQVVVDLEV